MQLRATQNERCFMSARKDCVNHRMQQVEREGGGEIPAERDTSIHCNFTGANWERRWSPRYTHARKVHLREKKFSFPPDNHYTNKKIHSGQLTTQTHKRPSPKQCLPSEGHTHTLIGPSWGNKCDFSSLSLIHSLGSQELVKDEPGTLSVSGRQTIIYVAGCSSSVSA